jgi:hypothetical protein
MTSRSRRLALLALALAPALVITGCDSGKAVGPGPHGQAALDRAKTVGSHRHATAKEVVAAGGPVDITGSGDRTMVTWDARDFEYGEGSHESAWSLYDDHEHRIAEGKFRWYAEDLTVNAVPGGFVIRQTARHTFWEFIDRDGQVTRLELPADEDPSRPGDVSLGFASRIGPLVNLRRPVVYRPGAHGKPGRVVRLTRVPGKGTSPEVSVASNGSVWLMDPNNDAWLRWSADGRAPWHTERVPIDARARAGQLVTIGAKVYVVAVRSLGGKDTALDSLWVRSAVPSARWTRIPIDGVKLSGSGRIGPSDGSIVLSQFTRGDQTGYAQLADGRFQPFSLAKGVGQDVEEVVHVIGHAIYVQPGETYNLKVSRDYGKTWKYVAR